MTALVVLGILSVIIVVVLTACYMNIKQLRTKELRQEIEDVKQVCLKRGILIRELRDQAFDYGYPADPLASVIVGKIREFEKENS